MPILLTVRIFPAPSRSLPLHTRPSCNNAILEQRWYAHQAHRSLFVYEMELLAPSTTGISSSTGGDYGASGGAGCVILMGSCNVARSVNINLLFSIKTLLENTDGGTSTSLGGRGGCSHV